MSGQVELTCLEASATRPHVLAGKLRAYAVLSKTWWPGAPNVPTIDEAGVPGTLSAVLARALGAEGNTRRGDRQAECGGGGNDGRPGGAETPD